MTRYKLTLEAQQDLRNIIDYLTVQGGPRVARYVTGTLTVAFRRLAKSPGIGHTREDLVPGEAVLFWPVFSYLVVYRRDWRPLAVVAVIHGNRDVAEGLRQRSL